MLTNYLKIALRNLFKYKGYSFIIISGLALGLACFILIQLYVQDERRYDRFHEKADQIYRLVEEGSVGGNRIRTAFTPPPWAPALANDIPEIVQAVRIKTPNSRWLISYEEVNYWERGFFFADASIFEVFDFPFVQGNPATALAEPNTVVLTEAAVEKYFGDEDPMGKMLTGDNLLELRVTGVMRNVPPNAHFHFDFLASFVTLETDQTWYGDLSSFQQQGLNHIIYTYLLLQDASSASAVEAKLPGFIEQYLGEELERRSIELRPFLQPLTAIHLHSDLEAEMEANSDIRYVYLFSALAALILLIACINFINLATARSAKRAREVGMRKVVGADRRQLIQQFIGESMLFVGIALVAAVGLVHLMLSPFNTLTGKDLMVDYGDIPAMLGLIGIALLVGLLAGSYPAFFLASFQPAAVLKGTMKARSTNVLLRKGLVITQFAVSVAMIVGTLILFHQLEYMRNKKLGFDKEHVVTMRLANQWMGNRYESYKQALLQNPHILGATGASVVPGGLIDFGVIRAAGASEEENLTALTFRAGHDFVETLGLELAAGRDFARARATDSTQAVLINETAARALGWDDPVGKEIEFPGSRRTQRRTVIGVVRDFHIKSLHQRIEPLVFAFGQPGNLWFPSIKIRGEDVSGALAFLQTTWNEIYPDYPFEYSFLDTDFDRLYTAEKRLEGIFGAFALFSIVIACLGLFGLASFMAEQRTKEIGVRKALGASVGGIVLLLSKDFVKLVTVAFVLGAPLAYLGMNRWLDDFAYRVDISWGIFLIAGSLSLAIAFLTISYQSIRAALADPVESLRYE